VKDVVVAYFKVLCCLLAGGGNTGDTAVRIACLDISLFQPHYGLGGDSASNTNEYSKCDVTSNKANSNLECAEDKFQTRGWVQGCEK
jgi:hypothetical protein